MRLIKLFMIVALMSIAMGASAQFSSSERVKAVSTSTPVSRGWNTVYFEWNPSSLNKDEDFSHFTGLTLGYNHAFSLTEKTPLYFETGLGLQYSFSPKKGGQTRIWTTYVDYDAKFWMLSAKIPFNLTYAIQVPNHNTTLLPYVGIGLRFNIVGKENENFNIEGNDFNKSFNIFNEDEMNQLAEVNNSIWKRFQMGWQIGVKARIAKKLMIGAGYYHDLSEIRKDVKISGGNISVGCVF